MDDNQRFVYDTAMEQSLFKLRNTNYEEYIDSRQLGGFHSFSGVLL